MAYTFLTPVVMSGLEVRDVRAEVVGALPDVSTGPLKAYNAGRYVFYSGSLYYHDGTSGTWTQLGAAGAGGPPSGSAGGDLTGSSYPNPVIANLAVTNAKLAADAVTDVKVASGAAIATSKINGLDTALTARALTATDLTAGNGLTGGGTAANRTFTVGAGTGITVNADDVAVDTATIATRAFATGEVTTHAGAADPHTGYQKETEKGVANGYAPLDAGNLVPTTHIPPLAINEVFTAANQAAMLALTAQRGDMCIRTDNNKTYVLSTDSPGTLADWKEIMAAGAVVSVNTQTGVVSLTAANVGAPSTGLTITAGAGLTGGGDLTTNRTLDVVSANGDMTVGTDNITINSAPKWTTGRTIALTGDVTGTSAAFDGTGNLSIATTAVGAGTAAKHFAGNVGAGTAVVINHALATRDVVVEVYRNSTPWDTVLCDVERTDTNNVTLRFATSVTASACRCVVTGR